MSDTQQIVAMLEKYRTERFYGTVAIQLRDGKVELVRVERTIKFQNEGNTRHEFSR
jgi:hypothetical protein